MQPRSRPVNPGSGGGNSVGILSLLVSQPKRFFCFLGAQFVRHHTASDVKQSDLLGCGRDVLILGSWPPASEVGQWIISSASIGCLVESTRERPCNRGSALEQAIPRIEASLTNRFALRA